MTDAHIVRDPDINLTSPPILQVLFGTGIFLIAGVFGGTATLAVRVVLDDDATIFMQVFQAVVMTVSLLPLGWLAVIGYALPVLVFCVLVRLILMSKTVFAWFRHFCAAIPIGVVLGLVFARIMHGWLPITTDDTMLPSHYGGSISGGMALGCFYWFWLNCVARKSSDGVAAI